MSVEKSEVKIAMAHEIGVRMDDALEAAKFDVARADGGAQEAARIASDIDSVLGRVQKDIDDGRLTMEAGKVVVGWVLQAKNVATSHAQQAAHAKILCQGRVIACEASVKLMLDVKTSEENKVRAAAAVETAPGDAGRPPPPIKAQRLAAEKKKAAPRARNSR